MSLDPDFQDIKRNFEIVVPEGGLEEKCSWSIKNNIPLRIKLGFDPTAPDLHLGHLVVLKKVRQFQNLGHTIVIIIGDFTASIGDPTGKNKTRPPLDRSTIEANAKTYLNQLAKVIDIEKAEIRCNSEWLNNLEMRDLVSLISKITLSQLLQREDFSNRYKQNIPIHFHELLYPIIQGYDSLIIESDIELGGTDQLFNCLVGRDIQSLYGKKQQLVGCVPILRGTDGIQKMSKSLKNYIGLTETPNDMYGKIMSIPDNLILEYARLVTDFSLEKIEEVKEALVKNSVNPMNLKKDIAYDVVRQFYGDKIAQESEQFFQSQVQSRNEEKIAFQPILFDDLKSSLKELTLISLCSALIPDKSKSEIRRIIQGGGVSLNGEKVTNDALLLEIISSKSLKLKIGKRNYFEVIFPKIA